MEFSEPQQVLYEIFEILSELTVGRLNQVFEESMQRPSNVSIVMATTFNDLEFDI
jgi:hypothetical protein